MTTSYTYKIIAYLFTTILLFSIVKSTSIVINFAINQDQIAKTLCVQKENQKGCFGKCQLVKALKKDVISNNEAPLQSNKNTSTSITYLLPITEIDFNSFYKITLNSSYEGLTLSSVVKHYEILTPPPKFS